MKLFAKLFKKSVSQKETEKETGKQTAYFQNGVMYKISEDLENYYYDARFIVSDGRTYDTQNIEDIRNIPIPNFPNHVDDVTKNLDYVLRIKARLLHDRNEKELCSAMLWKSTELMLHSSIGWSNEDYNRIIYYHNELGMFDEAEKARKFLQTYTPFGKFYQMSQIDSNALRHKNYLFSLIDSTGEDLVLFQDTGVPCCSECAKMLGRVYSVYGKNKKFPKLPDYVKVHGNFHHNCRCTMNLWSESLDKIKHRGEKADAIAMSHRPYVDDRTQYQIENYQKYLEDYEKQQENLKSRYEYSIRRGKCQKEYDKILEFMPELAPKSLKGYMRMKKMNTKNFLKLKEQAEKLGIIISD